MRQPAYSVRRGAPVSKQVSLPAPVGGLNARDSVANMDETDALVLDNFFPTPTSVDVRLGYDPYATFTGQCEAIIVYSGSVATSVFTAVVNGSTRSIFNGTAGGALSVPVVGGAGATVQAVTSTRYDYQNFGTIGGQFVVLVNGADPALQYDGSTWTVSTMTGVTTSDLFTVAVYEDRLWFGEKNSFSVWYLPVRSITGALTELNLASLFKRGGRLHSIVTLTDSLNDLVDYIAFVSTEGEVVAFAGTDPASITTWSRVAHFVIGRPVQQGNRVWTKYGADAVVMCADGAYPLRATIAAQKYDPTLSVTDKIRKLITGDVLIHGGRFGWQIMTHPTGSKLIVNVPTNENVAARQWVMNMQHGSWCKFTGWNAFCFEVSRDQLYFGGNGVLAKADIGHQDDDLDITADGKQAFNYFKSRGRGKLVTMIRPILAIGGQVNMAVDIDVDYEDTPPTVMQTIGVGSGNDPWGGIWDVTWAGATEAFVDWQTAVGYGAAIAPRLRLQPIDVNASWSATDLVYEEARGPAI